MKRDDGVPPFARSVMHRPRIEAGSDPRIDWLQRAGGKQAHKHDSPSRSPFT